MIGLRLVIEMLGLPEEAAMANPYGTITTIASHIIFQCVTVAVKNEKFIPYHYPALSNLFNFCLVHPVV